MTESPAEGASTQVSTVIDALREDVYRAFLDPDAVATWLPPDGMSGHVHRFDPREGGKFRISLTYQDPANSPGGDGREDHRGHGHAPRTVRRARPG